MKRVKQTQRERKEEEKLEQQGEDCKATDTDNGQMKQQRGKVGENVVRD